MQFWKLLSLEWRLLKEAPDAIHKLMNLQLSSWLTARDFFLTPKCSVRKKRREGRNEIFNGDIVVARGGSISASHAHKRIRSALRKASAGVVWETAGVLHRLEDRWISLPGTVKEGHVDGACFDVARTTVLVTTMLTIVLPPLMNIPSIITAC